ncbi:hypothetical protein [Aurantiacibacter poecillastricola]|uniref:hypothetical protein n=1 Tax=Aurantiacibacter poecillastricola TaxID=3064385 RepID=UPI00273DD9C8|nr:hypothetical protein [Aurantiacibacter sp. 219JJ12-13]MDP5262234.1 hypothetical protein [Aurantiacibacter sp. 219JJ12-13]
MIRTKTTLVIGRGASAEIEIPTGSELLGKIAQGFDFGRMGTDLQTDEMVRLAELFGQLAGRLDTTREKLIEAGQTIRIASRVSGTIEDILDQHSHDPLVVAAGKLAIAFYTLQAEARSPLGLEPRDPGDLPLRGNENWLFQVSRLILGGVPRDRLDESFENLSVISFCYDRALQHYLPWAMHMAYDMSLGEARRLVAEKLKIIYPLGSAGRLPWQPGKLPEADWGAEEASNLETLLNAFQLPSERERDTAFAESLHSAMAQAERLVLLGFNFDPSSTSLLLQAPLGHDPDILVAMQGTADTERAAVARLLKRNAGISDPALITIRDVFPFQLLRDEALYLAS